MGNTVISIVDDDHSVREALGSLIRSVGFAVQAFSSAEAFLSSPNLTRTDCLLLDIHMPGMDGVALRRILKRDFPAIPVVFITAHWSEEEARSTALAEGAVDSLLKPLSEDAVLSAVRTALVTKRAD